METNKLYCGDCLEVLKTMADNSVDAVVTDPPYGLSSAPDIVEVLTHWLNDTEYKHPTNGFMGKTWDSFVPAPTIWREALRVLKPGGHLLCFSAPRTVDLMNISLRLAGFEIRDMIAWVYGCLSEDTEILTTNGWERYHRDIASSTVLCFNIDNDSFEFHKPIRSFIYDNKHTAYRIQSDNTDQIVSRNHRVIIERDGRKIFAQAEALEQQADIPILESLSDLPEAIYNNESRTSIAKHDLLKRVHKQDVAKQAKESDNSSYRNFLSAMWKNIYDKKKKDIEILLLSMQWKSKRTRLETTRMQGQESVDSKIKRVIFEKYDRRQKSFLERWSDIFQKSWQLFTSEIYKMSERIFAYGSKERLCYGAQNNNGAIAGTMFAEDGSCSSYKSQSAGQSPREFDAIRKQSETQAIRSTRATVTPIEYNGKVWCVETPTGAFVARRNSKIFITGNSGFPKSLNIGKAIDKMQGNEREYLGLGKKNGGASNGHLSSSVAYSCKTNEFDITKGHSDFEGFGTALKPAMEMITVARKPISEKTIAENCLKWRTGALNIDGCRIGTTDNRSRDNSNCSPDTFFTGKIRINQIADNHGRFPANLIHDGSEEVLALFPNSKTSIKETIKETKHSPSHINFKNSKSGMTLQYNFGDSGSNARFFYCAKASKSERNKNCEEIEVRVRVRQGLAGEHKNTASTNSHPTVKPVALMEYLVKLVTLDENSIVLDPFAGSGTTGVACQNLKRKYILIEREPKYCEIIENRLSISQPKVAEVKMEEVKEEYKQLTLEDF